MLLDNLENMLHPKASQRMMECCSFVEVFLVSPVFFLLTWHAYNVLENTSPLSVCPAHFIVLACLSRPRVPLITLVFLSSPVATFVCCTYMRWRSLNENKFSQTKCTPKWACNRSSTASAKNGPAVPTSNKYYGSLTTVRLWNQDKNQLYTHLVKPFLLFL